MWSTDATVIDLDKLTYAGHLESLAEAYDDPRHVFVRGDVCDTATARDALRRHRLDAVMHVAAETHVDRSIDSPRPFVDTNVVGTFTMLEATRGYWRELDGATRARFHFVQVSTGEALGSMGPEELAREATAYRPNSPYAASKATADHPVRAWHETYGLPTIVTSGCNSFGPYQFLYKLVLRVILAACDGAAVPVYGKGENERDWLHVDDHARALRLVLAEGRPGASYNIAAGNRRTNLALVEAVGAALDALRPGSPHRPYPRLIAFDPDRPGHDTRYALDTARIARELGWTPSLDLDQALRATVEWYLANRDRCSRASAGAYGGERRGLAAPRG